MGLRGRTVEPSQAPTWPSILRRNVAQFSPVRAANPGPDGSLPVAFRYAGERGILGGFGA